MQVPPPRQNPLPATPPPAIDVRASQDDVDRLFKHQEIYKVAEFAYKIEEVAEAVQEKTEEQQELSRELEEATSRLSYEQSQPVIDRRQERSRDKRGR